ncbi:DmX-like protein 2 isoform A [Senna tora]|uniref:DmX-like protein 2 isoform A n=1 Tax=Senna tora TaxID=362788 RepID=A0A834XHJ5_9FABA|nr:DmX-like protein 2 isoform A [Senna tora]
MIQWRPSRGKLSNRKGRHSARDVLLTCCLDGTLRLWSEIDNGKARKTGKDVNDQKSMGHSYCVVSVIEINQSLNGTLGLDTFVTWGTESGGIFKTGDGAHQVFSKEGFDHEVGKCDWLIGFGPGMLLTFWAIHCLDDLSALRFPRVTLWRRHELQGPELGNVYRFDSSDFRNALLLNKVILLRNCWSGPPVICSPVQLLPCNSLIWSFFHIQTLRDSVENSLGKANTENISYLNGGVLNLDGHGGRILKVSIHPCICEVQIAASLDSDGLVLFWSLSRISNCTVGYPTLIPIWELCGKLVTQDSCSMYTSLRWAPSVFYDELVLFMGHARGIDCFIVKFCQTEEEYIEYHYFCTIPFSGHGPYEDGPTDISAISLCSTCNKTFSNNKLMLLAIWMGGFQALSWEIILHSFDMSTSCCECNFDDKSLTDHSMWAFESTFAGKRYCITVNPCSSEFSSSLTNNQVTSFSVASPTTLSPRQQKFGSANDICSSYPAYIMATGCTDGSLKLWRSNPGNPSTLHLPWELVGMFAAHEGPVNGICLTDCGQKIATFCNNNNSNPVSTIHIWHALNLTSGGTFILEDKLTLDSYVVTLNWLTLGTGQLLLGVCLQNELQVYSQRRYDGLTLSNLQNCSKVNIWICIASAHTSLPIYDFLWGPRAAAVVVHRNYFGIFSHWLFHVDKKQWSDFHSCDAKANIFEDKLSAVFSDSDVGTSKELSIRDSNMMNNELFSSLYLANRQLESQLCTNTGLWSIFEVVEQLCGSLPIYHPDVLLINISSGHWKRAYVAVRHLVEFLTSTYAPEKSHASEKAGPPEILLSNYFEGLVSGSSQDKGLQWSGEATLSTSFSQFETENTSSTRSELSRFIESLENLPELAAMVNIKKTEILAVVDLLSEVNSPHLSSAYQSLDEPGRRFWVGLRFQQLQFVRNFSRVASVEELGVNSRLFVWAYHSDCKENLFGSVIPNEPSWQEMRALGIGFWFANVPQLRARMEKLARAQYLKNKNPKDCALLYIALNRTQVLAGLFKISRDEKDKPLVGFLSRNFQDEKNKAAALKNAYVLLGKHQFELAIAFFLLGGDNSSAINICAKNLGDEQLALVICRLVEGHGGPLERHLITKYILPSAIDKGDYWLVSLLEWEMGNYYQSFRSMLDISINSIPPEPIVESNCGPFLDPNVGFYCQMLATKNSLKNAVGEQNSAILLRWATLMTATSLNRCGTPLEALECFSSSLSMLGTAEQGSTLDAGLDVLSNNLNPFPRKSANWLSADVSVHLEFHTKSNLALQYLSKLLKEHPSWPDNVAGSNWEAAYSDEYMVQYDKSLENLRQKLYTGLALFEQRFLLGSSCLLGMILFSLCHQGLLNIGYDIAGAWTPGDQSQKNSAMIDAYTLYHSWLRPLFKTTIEISYFFSRVFSASSMDYSQQRLTFSEKDAYIESRSKVSNAWQSRFGSLLISFWYLRAILRIQFGSCSKNLMTKTVDIINLFEYYLHFSSAWLQKNSEALFLMVQPFLIAQADGHNPHEVDIVNLKKLIPKTADLLIQDSLIDNTLECGQDMQDGDIKQLIPDDEKWMILGSCLWQHISRFMINNLNMVLDTIDDGNLSGSSHRKYDSKASTLLTLDSDSINLPEKIRLVSLNLCELLKTTVTHSSSYHTKQLAAFLWQKLEYNSNLMTLEWLKRPSQSEFNQNHSHEIVNLELVNRKDKNSVYQILWDHCANPKLIFDCFAQEKLNCSNYFGHLPTKGWNDMYITMTGLHKSDDMHDHGYKVSGNRSSHDVGSPVKSALQSGHASVNSHHKDTTTRNITLFQNPRELHKRNGELLEALCINSTNQQEAAIASNRKGIIFFHLDDGIPSGDKAVHLWSEADWPLNGWAGTKSSPAPTCVSPGVGLGNNKGAHLGLGGATVGVGSSAWPSKDLTVDGAFGIPRYANIGASRLGWEIQQDFEDPVDPPATVENISTRALSSHPLRPFFLVGSSNTHIYLWEFNKDKATATYGVLPAANVPPPYALASISALQFDHCGHRFASAASDGTVCTWQLEVGGRSNIRPTESSLCFSGHASDVTYFSSSGSIIAVAGYNSSNNLNVVLWDTLAPSTTSRVSILCHEGGARSLSVLDNDVGSGSISPLIVTGGKNGDVGVHDFRYVATGKAKRHRYSDSSEQSSSTSSNSDKDKNVNGMLWYIPKAHSGSITKIAAIPYTSLFLTGSKDGDVKLWDVKSTKLVHQWSKLHEKHTFLQPSSRGFGGVVRAAVTDIQVISHGFLSCGGDGTVKLVSLNKHALGHEVKL